MEKQPTVRPVKAGWWNIFRPWTLHGAIVPALIGGAMAFDVVDIKDPLNLLIWVLVIIGCALFQSVANILNTYGDFVKGTDTVENETRSPELVTGVLRPKDVRNMGLLCIGIICLIGIVLIWFRGWSMLIFGAVGIFGATMYTVGMSYKYLGLGQIMCFIMFGLLMPLGTYFTLTGQLSWELLLFSLPNAFMITGVLAGNEMRDYYEDKKANVGTLCGRMSYEHGMKLYLFMSLVSFPILLVLMIAGIAPWWCALSFITLYDAYMLYKNSKRAPTDPHSSFMLVPMCFKLNWHFGVLLVIGYLVQMQLIPLVM